MSVSSNQVSHQSDCPCPRISYGLIAAFTERLGRDPMDVDIAQEPTVVWGLDSLDFVVAMAGVDEQHGSHLVFPTADLHALSLPALADVMAQQACICHTP